MFTCVVELTTSGAAPVATLETNCVPVTVPFTVWLVVKTFAALSWGTLVVSRFSVTFPDVPPPARSAPAVTPVMVPAPVPGKVCPLANVILPLLAICSPVSAGTLVPDPYSKLRAPLAVAVLLPTGSPLN